jgi:predicted acylesterase/phospholipase RssA/energy-coupling factor transporter ATP-binding protein EcfA2
MTMAVRVADHRQVDYSVQCLAGPTIVVRLSKIPSSRGSHVVDTTELSYTMSDNQYTSQDASRASQLLYTRSELDRFEEPLIDLSLPPSTPTISVSGVNWTSTQTKPLIPSPTTDQGIAWGMAHDSSLLDRDDLDDVHPAFRHQKTAVTGQNMLRVPPQLELKSLDPVSQDSIGQGRRPPHLMIDHSTNEFAKPSGHLEDEEADDWCCDEARRRIVDRHSCSPCGLTFCDQCWDKQRAHKKVRAQNQGGIPHEKTNPAVAKTIETTLEPILSDEEQEKLHVQDQDTFWFGAGKDEQDDMVFQDHGRYANLMAEQSSRKRKLRYPALVSFVGQTGAGKSTLIKLLIELHSSSERRVQVPVVGSVIHPDTPTSGDVHLYCDPESFDSEHPVLYADCEGLDGGEREPFGARSRNRNCTSRTEHQKKRSASFSKHIRGGHRTSEREILWATTEPTRSREYYVRNLYPRLLYTFSDVIVFVMKNPRVIENVIEQLIRWAAAVLETSSNQPVLPNAVIVLNASENATDPELWDVTKSTDALMESVQQALHQNHTLRKYAEFWRERKGSIESVMSLLLSYYSGVRVVRVPERGRPKLINQQLQRLYEEITTACERSRASKHKVRMLLNSDELQPYLQYAFDHFCRDLEVPFDFVQASFANSPIPSDLGGNVLKLAINVMDVWKDRLDGPNIFKELSFIVASCIMLDSARHRTLGPADKVFREYIEHCDDALDDFCNRHWPCEYMSNRGRCVNVKAGHNSKGHQLKSGQVLAVGAYSSSFTPEIYRVKFRNDIYTTLAELLEKLHEATKNSTHRELEKAGEIHRDYVLRNFFHHLNGSQSFMSHTACFSCLVSPPEHPLPCGHILCTPCVKAFGTPYGRAIIEMKYCPLHHNETEGQFEHRWPVSIKPHSAGVRVLCLDGGGIRGIVELTVLEHIEQVLGMGLAIQSFFDLIVGTSTGGLIALGLGARGWSVQRCIKTFQSLCTAAFNKRRGVGLLGRDFYLSPSNHNRYETKPLETSLKSAFGDESLFGGLRDPFNDVHDADRTTKVAVTTTTTNGTLLLLANYNRMDTNDGSNYQLHRSEKPHAEMKLWEAARATSAASRMFKPFRHKPSGQILQDAAIYYNNPIELAMRETRLIWPDVAEAHPDVVLSLGTSLKPDSSKQTVTPHWPLRRGKISHGKHLAKIALDPVHSTLNSEQTWFNFTQGQPIKETFNDRYIRLNVPLQHNPPEFDEFAAMAELQDMTRSRCTMRRDEMKSIAERLIATSFYFERNSDIVTEHEDHTIIINGSILCRFGPGSDEIRALGEVFRKRSTDAYNQNFSEHNPYFVVQDGRKGREAAQHVIATHVVDKMIRDAHFSFGPVMIHLSDKMAETTISLCFGDRPKESIFYPISGSPRCLLEEERKLRSQNRLSLRLSRIRTPSTPLRRGAWTLPYHTVETGDRIERYADPDYRFPGNATSDAITEISQRFSSSLASSASSMPSQPDTSPYNLRVPAGQYLEPPVGYAELAGQQVYEVPDFEQIRTRYEPLASLQRPAFQQERALQERPAWKERPISTQELPATQYLDSGDGVSSWEVSPLTAD